MRNALSDYRRTLESLGSERTLLVATSAVRDAENGEAFLGEIEWSYGFATQLVSGDEEAELTRRGVQPPRGTLVLDIGGGSTELLVDDFHVSLDIGSVRFTERFVFTDPPARDEIDACARAVRSLLSELERGAARGDRCRRHGDLARRARPRPRRVRPRARARPPALARGRARTARPARRAPAGTAA